MDIKYPHINWLLEAILKYPSDSLDYWDAPTVINQYIEGNNYGEPADPTCQALRAELVELLTISDRAFTAIVGEPDSQDWEHGVPEIEEIKDFFSKYIAEIDKRHRAVQSRFSYITHGTVHGLNENRSTASPTLYQRC